MALPVPPSPCFLVGVGVLFRPDPCYLWSCFGTAPASCESAPDDTQVLPVLATWSMASAHCRDPDHLTLTGAPVAGRQSLVGQETLAE